MKKLEFIKIRIKMINKNSNSTKRIVLKFIWRFKIQIQNLIGKYKIGGKLLKWLATWQAMSGEFLLTLVATWQDEIGEFWKLGGESIEGECGNGGTEGIFGFKKVVRGERGREDKKSGNLTWRGAFFFWHRRGGHRHRKQLKKKKNRRRRRKGVKPTKKELKQV